MPLQAISNTQLREDNKKNRKRKKTVPMAKQNVSKRKEIVRKNAETKHSHRHRTHVHLRSYGPLVV